MFALLLVLSMADPLLEEMIKRAAVENAALVDPKPAAQPEGEGKAPWLAYLASLAGDVGTTAIGAATGRTEEANPLMKAFGNKGAAPLVAGTSLGGMLLAKKLLGKNHPKLLKGLLYGMAGAHGGAAVNNAVQMGRAGDVAAVSPTNDIPPFPGAVKTPSGAWINPDYFPGQ